MKKIIRYVCMVVSFFFLCSAFCGCDAGTNGNNHNENETASKSEIVNESVIKSLFLSSAKINKDGEYFFEEETKHGTTTYCYTFSYSPSKGIYYLEFAESFYATNLNMIMFDYASISFKWGKIKNARFYASHRLGDVAIISFNYYNIIFNDYNVNDSYTYKVSKNTFAYLTNKNDIDEYASNSFFCIRQLFPYMQRVLKQYNIKTNLW